MTDFDALARRLGQLAPGLELRFDEPMSRHTTFRIGGPARLMAVPRTEEEAVAAFRAALSLGVEPVTVGNGSNLLVDDRGLDRFVLKTVPGLGWCRRDGLALEAGSGVTLAALAAQAQRQGLSGLEFAHGIPGSLGGGVTMNAGAYGGELSQVVAGVRWLDGEGNLRQLPPAGCDFSYRHSLFSGGGGLVLSARVELRAGDPAAIRAAMEELMARRREKQPLEYPSAGSAFKRPAGHYAAQLIDRCGLKGLAVGGARVSDKHAGFIVNTGGATCRDVLDLMDTVRTLVRTETGVELEPEIRYLK